MRKFNKIVQSYDEPNHNDIWVKNNTLNVFTEDGWIPIPMQEVKEEVPDSMSSLDIEMTLEELDKLLFDNDSDTKYQVIEFTKPIPSELQNYDEKTLPSVINLISGEEGARVCIPLYKGISESDDSFRSFSYSRELGVNRYNGRYSGIEARIEGDSLIIYAVRVPCTIKHKMYIPYNGATLNGNEKNTNSFIFSEVKRALLNGERIPIVYVHYSDSDSVIQMEVSGKVQLINGNQEIVFFGNEINYRLNSSGDVEIVN